MERTLKEYPVFESKNLGIKRIETELGGKIMSCCESAYFLGRNHEYGINGVGLVPIIKYKDRKSELLLIANFRPPLNKFSLQIPAGLVQSTDFEGDAIRQLKEQTGYTPKQILEIPLPTMYSDPWKSNDCGKTFIAIIDGDDPNSKDSQQLQESQNIRIHRVILDQHFYQSIIQLVKANNYVLEKKIWIFAMALMIFDRFKL